MITVQEWRGTGLAAAVFDAHEARKSKSQIASGAARLEKPLTQNARILPTSPNHSVAVNKLVTRSLHPELGKIVRDKP